MPEHLSEGIFLNSCLFAKLYSFYSVHNSTDFTVDGGSCCSLMWAKEIEPEVSERNPYLKSNNLSFIYLELSLNICDLTHISPFPQIHYITLHLLRI